MKTRFKRLGKSSLSLALSVLMIVSTVLVGSSNTIDVPNADEVIGAGVVQNTAVASDSAEESASVSEIEKTAAVDDKSIDTSQDEETSTNVADTSKKSTPNASGATAPESSGATTLIRVYFQNVNSRTSLNAYVYGGTNGEYLGEWRGTSVLSNIEKGLNYIDVYSDNKLMFNWYKSNGGSAQVDCGTATAGRIYTESGSTGVSFSDYEAVWDAFDSQSCSNTLYFKNNSSWSTVNCYAWSNITSGSVSVGYSNADWPGSAMELVTGTTDIYKITLDKPYAYVQFNDGGSNKIDGISLQYTSGTTTLSKNYYNNGFGDNYVENTNPTTLYNTVQQVGVTGTVSGIPDTSESGDTVEFTVTPPAGFTVGSVKANNVDCSYDSSTGKYSYTVASSSVNVKIIYNYTVYFNKGSLDWSTVYAYAFDSSKNPLIGTWQGKQMTSLGNGLYSIVIPSDTVGIIFSKENKNDDSDQTVDIAVSTDNVGQTWTATSTNTGSTKQTGNWPASYYLRGDNTKIKTVANEAFSGDDLWSSSVLNPDSKFQIDSNGQYYLDVTLNSGATFKVIDKDKQWYSPSNSDGNRTMTVGSNNCDLYTRSSTENITFNGSNNTKCRIYISKTVSNQEASFSVYLKALYTVTINDTRTDPVTTSYKYALENDTVTISSTLNSQNQIPYATYNSKTLVLTKDTSSANFTGTFTMPASDTTVTIGYRDAQTFTVNAALDTLNSNHVYGTYTATSQEVTEGDNITLTVTHDPGYVPVWEFSNNHYKLISKNTTVSASSGSSSSAGKNNIQSSGATTGATSTITFMPLADVNVYITFTEATAALTEYTGSGAYLFGYTQKPQDATAAANNATRIKLYSNSSNEVFARLIVGSSTDLANDVIKYDTNFYFAYSDTNDATTTYKKCNNNADKNNLLNDSTADGKTAVPGMEYNGQNFDDHEYQYLYVNPKNKAKEVYLYIGTISGNTVNFRNQSSPFKIDATIDTSTTNDNTVTVYAKTGTIRSVDENDNDSAIGDYDKFSLYSDITLKYADDNSAVKTIDSKPYAVSLGNGATATHYRLRTATAEKNRDIIVTATIHDSTAQGKYFIKGFCVNGETKGIVDGKSANNQYSFTFKINSSQTVPIEITPIYYLIDDSDCVTLRVEDFTGEVKSKWGKTISCYAWYYDGIDTNGSASTQHALGGYPGQPMIEQGGSYYMQIPRKNIDGKAVKGVTMNNYVWDDVHGGLIGYAEFNGINSGGKEGSNAQTYDYDDFLALSHLDDVDTIIFNFKYNTDNGSQSGGQGTGANTGNFNGVAVNAYPETTNLNENNSYTHTGQNETTGWHALVDYHDVPVDLFGNRIDITQADNSEDNKNLSELKNHKNYDLYSNHHYYNDEYILNRVANNSKFYVISDGYVNYYGEYKDGNPISNETNPNPLKSDGREYLGEYATMWSVYEYTSTDTYEYIGSLPPSAFITKATYKTDYADWLKADGKLKTFDEKNSIPPSFLDYTATAWNSEGVPTAYSMGVDAREAMWKQFVKIYNKCYNMPVEIKYEASIKSGGRDGSNNGNNKDIGTRCDGRWYYSRANDPDPILGNVKVWILDNSDATSASYIFKEKLDGTNVNRYIEDKFINPNDTSSYTGTVTTAKARFTNETPYDLITNESFKNKTKAVVSKDASKFFDLMADSLTLNGYDYSVGEGGYATKVDSTSPNTTYSFVGWYLYTGGQLNPMSTNNITTRDMGSDATMIAVYEKVTKTDGGKTLTVIHDLYANHKDSKYDSLTQDNNDPAVTNGTNGNTYVSIKVTETGTDGKTYYFNDNAGSFIVPSEALSKEDSTVTITVYTTPGADNTVYVDSNGVPGVYMYDASVTSGTKYKTVETVSGTETPSWTYDTAKTATGTSTYTTTVGALFGTGNNAVTDKTLYFFTNLFRTYINVTVKYYDRDVSNDSHSKPVDMSTTPKAVPITLKGITNDTTVGQLAVKLRNEFKITENEMDEYTFWASQAEATSSIGAFYRYNEYGDKYEQDDEKEITYNAKFGEGNEAFAYHTDRYGYPQIEETVGNEKINHYADIDANDEYTRESRERWVVFSDAAGNEITDNDELDANSRHLQDISSVVIWLYNKPKEYTFNAVYTPETTGTVTTSAVKNIDDNLYIATETPEGATNIVGFYNERLGKEDKRTGVQTNEGTNYLSGYGITNALFGPDKDGLEVKAVENATYSYTNDNQETVNKALVFDGWYISNSDGSYSKVSTDRSYQNRITNDLTIYAGYRPKLDGEGKETQGEKVVVSVSDVVVDTYVDTNEKVQVRFNTQLNVSGTDVVDNDDNIKYVTAIYFDLPTTDKNNKSINWATEDNINALNSYLSNPQPVTDVNGNTVLDENGKQILKTGAEIISGYVQKHIDKIATKLADNGDVTRVDENGVVTDYYRTYTQKNYIVKVGNVTTTETGKVDCFTYKVVAENPSVTDHTVTLTNKNRIQFTLPMSYSDYISKPFLAYVAIKYDNSSNVEEGETAINDWFVSENYVSNLSAIAKSAGIPSSSTEEIVSDEIDSEEEVVLDEIDSEEEILAIETVYLN